MFGYRFYKKNHLNLSKVLTGGRNLRIKVMSQFVIKIIIVCFVAPSIGFAGGLLDDYGTEEHSLVIDMMVSKMSRNSESIHKKESVLEQRVGYQNRGHFNYAIIGENSDTPDIRYFKPQGFHVHSSLENEIGVDSLSQCSSNGMQSLLNSEVGAEENMQVVSSGLRKWQVYREPGPLRYSRYKIYFIRKAIRKLNERLETETSANRVSTLTKLVEKLRSSHSDFLKERSDLLEKDLKWNHRRWVHLNLDRNHVECVIGKPLEIPRVTEDPEVKNNSLINIVAFKLQEFSTKNKALKDK